MLVGMKRVEIGDAIDAEQHGLAVDDELLAVILQRRLDNPRIAVGPVVAAAGDQANAIPLALQAEAIAVLLHFVQPDRVIGDGGRHGGQAKFEGAGHCRNGVAGECQIAGPDWNCESHKSPSRVRFRAELSHTPGG